MKYAITVDEQFLTRLLHEMLKFDIHKPGDKIVVEDHDANCAAMQLARALVPFFEKELKEAKNDAS